ncbi:hypothetical protein C0989_011249 [Termitomyces sp. Mn162]|nr:hypothetical protein C0989_011249 [Termitomyces sp. Mn162]
MLCARFINGVGTGHLNAIVPVWSAEVATHTTRVKAGRLHEAKELLQRLRAPSDPLSGEKEEHKQAREEYEAIVDAVQLGRKHASMNNYWNMFWGKGA